jgi:hypothetical protein
MKRLLLPIVLGLLALGLFLTSVAMAAPAQPLMASLNWHEPLDDDPPDGTDPLSPTKSISHPVASAIAENFNVPYGEVKDLHDEGYGFGVIVKAYFLPKVISDLGLASDVTPDGILSDFQQGMGWGEIIKDLTELPPGQAMRGQNLGAIMSGREKNKGESWMPPGQQKKLKPNQDAGNVPPGWRFKSGDNDDEESGKTPGSPPGHNKNKDKGKAKGKR